MGACGRARRHFQCRVALSSPSMRRLVRPVDWPSVGDAPQAAQGRLIRLIDATTVPKAGTLARRENKLWRIHSAFDLPSERFGIFSN